MTARWRTFGTTSSSAPEWPGDSAPSKKDGWSRRTRRSRRSRNGQGHLDRTSLSLHLSGPSRGVLHHRDHPCQPGHCVSPEPGAVAPGIAVRTRLDRGPGDTGAPTSAVTSSRTPFPLARLAPLLVLALATA